MVRLASARPRPSAPPTASAPALHLGHHLQQRIHDLLAPVHKHAWQGALKARSLPQPDRLAQFGQLGVGQFSHLLQAFLLARVVARQVGQCVDVLLDPAKARLVRIEVPLIAGEEKTALAGFGIEVRRENVVQLLLDLVGVDHPAVRFQQALRAR